MNIEHVSSDGLAELALLTAIDEHFELPPGAPVRCADDEDDDDLDEDLDDDDLDELGEDEDDEDEDDDDEDDDDEDDDAFLARSIAAAATGQHRSVQKQCNRIQHT